MLEIHNFLSITTGIGLLKADLKTIEPRIDALLRRVSLIKNEIAQLEKKNQEQDQTQVADDD